jgi:hypothetical protein
MAEGEGAAGTENTLATAGTDSGQSGGQPPVGGQPSNSGEGQPPSQDTAGENGEGGGAGGQTPPAEGGQGQGGDQGAEAPEDAGEGQGGEAGEQGPPEQYEFQAPEGMELDQDALAQVEPVFRELGLNNEQAQKVLDAHMNHMASFQQQQEQQRQQQVEQWANEVRQDPDIGGDKLDENLATARKALDTFASEGFQKLLDQTGLGNHPDVVKTFHAIGQKVSEDNLVTGDSPGNEPPNPANLLYPNESK